MSGAPSPLTRNGYYLLARQAHGNLEQRFDENGVDVCFEVHRGENFYDGATFEMFLIVSFVTGGMCEELAADVATFVPVRG